MKISDDVTRVLQAARAENLLIENAPKMEDTGKMTFADFVRLADRWAALDARHRAAAMMVARGSIDGATDMIGPRYRNADDAADEICTPPWDLVGELLFDIDEHGFKTDATGWTSLG